MESLINLVKETLLKRGRVFLTIIVYIRGKMSLNSLELLANRANEGGGDKNGDIGG